MMREMGRGNATATIVFLSALAALATLPLAGGLGVIGYALMQAFDDKASFAILGALFTLFPIFGGITSGLVAGARELAWERYRAYPIRMRSLFAAELVAAFGDVIPFFVALASASITIGMGIAQPRVLVVAPLILFECVLTVLVVQMLVGGLAEVIVKRLRNAFVLILTAVLVAIVVVSTRSRGPSSPTGFIDDQAREGFRYLTYAIQWLPTGAAIRSLGLAKEGHLVHALALHIYPLVTLTLLCFVAAWLMAREADNTRSPTERKAPARVWTFRSPWFGVARAHADILMKSPLGRFGWLMPLISLVLIKGPLAHTLGSARWSTLSSFSYVAISTIQLHFGAFGMDGHGIKTLLLLPITPRELLVGKMSAVALYHFLQLSILTIFLFGMGDTTVANLIAGFFLAISIFFTQAAVGHRVSVWMPRAFPKRGMRRTAMPLPLTLLSLGTFLVSALLYGAAFVIGTQYGPYALLGVMFGGVLLSVSIYLALLPGVPAFFERHREKLLTAVGE